MGLPLSDARETRQRCRSVVEPALNDNDPVVRDLAIDAMAELGDKDLFARLARFVSASDGLRYLSLREGDMIRARFSMRAVRALTSRGYQPAPERLTDALRSTSREVQDLALGTLAELATRGEAWASLPLAAAIAGPRQRTAARLCGEVCRNAPPPAAQEPLRALEALIGGEDEAALPAEQAHLAAGSDAARHALVRRLGCGEWRKALAAAHTLARAAAGARHLLDAADALLTEQKVGENRRVGLCAAAVVLARSGAPAAIERVRVAAEHDEWDIRIEGAEALCALGEVGRGRAVLSAALRAPASAPHGEAAAALVRRFAAGDDEAPLVWRGRLHELSSRPPELEILRAALARAMAESPGDRHLPELASLMASGPRRVALVAAVATVRALRASQALPEPEPLVFATDPYQG